MKVVNKIAKTNSVVSRIRKWNGERITQNDIDSAKKVVYFDIGKKQVFDNFNSNAIQNYKIKKVITSNTDTDILFVSCMTSYIESENVLENPKWETFDCFVTAKIETYRQQNIKNQLIENNWCSEETTPIPHWSPMWAPINFHPLSEEDRKLVIDTITEYVNEIFATNNVDRLVNNISSLSNDNINANVLSEILTHATIDADSTKKAFIDKITNMSEDELTKFVVGR